MKILLNMKESAWIDYDTSMVSIEMNLFYPPETIFTFVYILTLKGALECISIYNVQNSVINLYLIN